MAYNRGRKALYEVINKNKPKSVFLHGEEENRAEINQPQPESHLPNSSGWPRKATMLRYNRGIIELFVPYQIAIAAGLVLILLLIVAFRLGQGAGGKQVASAGIVNAPKAEVKQNRTPLEFAKSPTPEVKKPTTIISAGQGENVIVVVQYKNMKDLLPVQTHFASFEITTEIIGEKGRYFLVTKQKYESLKPGSDGDKAQKKIVEVGAKYKGKAPSGYETFAPNYFSDAYGRNVSSF